MYENRLTYRQKIRNILVSIVGKIQPRSIGLEEDKWSSSNRFGHIPDEGKVNGIAICGVKALNAQIVVIHETMVGVGFGRRGLRPSRSFPVLHTPSHAVEGHDDVGRRGLRAACPEDGPVLAVVLDGPYAGGGLDQRLVAVVVELGDEFLAQRRRVAEVGD